MLSDKEKEELKYFSKSIDLRNDFRKIAENRINPLLINGKINLDNLISFLNGFNEFVSHKGRPFHKIKTTLNKM